MIAVDQRSRGCQRLWLLHWRLPGSGGVVLVTGLLGRPRVLWLRLYTCGGGLGCRLSSEAQYHIILLLSLAFFSPSIVHPPALLPTTSVWQQTRFSEWKQGLVVDLHFHWLKPTPECRTFSFTEFTTALNELSKSFRFGVFGDVMYILIYFHRYIIGPLGSNSVGRVVFVTEQHHRSGTKFIQNFGMI